MKLRISRWGDYPGRPNKINVEPDQERRKHEVSVRKRDVTMKAEVSVI